LVIGGVEIPHDKGLLGHSDADVLTHAVADALLGAAALGDIGQYFPDTNGEYKDISSLVLLEQVRRLLTAAGYKISNIDAVITAQEPKLSPYIGGMRRKIAGALGIAADRVGVKATTTERMGFEGRQEGISAQAVCIITEARRKRPLPARRT
jgi:2-C-methyl-D-erythritol 2,4-cyclodiphosphate synthase